MANLIYVLDRVKCSSSKQTTLANIQKELVKAKVNMPLVSMSDFRKVIGVQDKFWGKDKDSAIQRSRFLSREKLETEDWDLIRDCVQTFQNTIIVVPFFASVEDTVRTDAIRGAWYSDKVIFIRLSPFSKWVSPRLDECGNIVKDGYYTWDEGKVNIEAIFDFDSFVGRRIYFDEPTKYDELRAYNNFCDFEVNNLCRISTIDLFESEKCSSWELTKKNIVDGVDIGYNLVLEGSGKGQAGLFKKRSVSIEDIMHNDIELLTLKWLKEHDAIDLYQSLNVGTCPVCNHKTRMSVASKCNFCGYTFAVADLLEAGVEDATAFVSPEALSTDRHEVFSSDDAESDSFEDSVYFDDAE